MFAVPGWNLSAPLKAEAPTPKAGGANGSKKRKRKEGKQQGAQVSGENVGDMWAQVVEGVPAPAAATAKSDNKNKKQRRESEGKPENKKAEEAHGSKKSEGKKKGNKHEKKQKDKQHDKKQQQRDVEQPAAETIVPAIPAVPPPLPPANTKLTPLQAKMREKLVGARFRHLNQTLYTTPSQHSLKLIEEDPQIFNEYHAGFRQQVSGWPENPVDTFVSLVQTRGAVRENWRDKILKRKEKEYTSGRYRKPGEAPPDEAEDSEEEERKRAEAAAAHQLKPLPRTRGTSIIADLGCGDAALATKLLPHQQSLNLRVHSFDLAAPSPLITKADIANLPLEDGSIDVAVFCLALMGTNWLDFIDEAWRVLHWKGELWIAEIKSRFGRVSNPREKKVVDHSVGKRQKKLIEAARKKSGADKKDKEAAAQEEEEDLAVEVDGVASGKQETDVSAFVEVLRKRGFVLDAPDPSRERDAVDLRNKMFVRMSFVKAAAPVKGKNVKANEKVYAENAARLAAESGKTYRKKEPKAKFIEADEDGIDESAVLKPCLYKQR
ncbi:Methyltransferase-related protein [Lasiodiplodia theobromae]|uniref:Ribosomal RNA-processing protein 8 n=1 Tax=Lasiodiplodia theobromae TaxID=45133 RepID=A0A8H7IRU4_9PEZI|nr:Methyltransferase [Lasiodiplodia theobromae]KAF4546416.1 Methyltransferase [Lasiodiplodia theobromae]KAF9630556.1 Methyltransferase-related protein [Lasiodiplodia theobromae]